MATNKCFTRQDTRRTSLPPPSPRNCFLGATPPLGRPATRTERAALANADPLWVPPSPIVAGPVTRWGPYHQFRPQPQKKGQAPLLPPSPRSHSPPHDCAKPPPAPEPPLPPPSLCPRRPGCLPRSLRYRRQRPPMLRSASAPADSFSSLLR